MNPVATSVHTHVIEIKQKLSGALTAVTGYNVYELDAIKQWGEYLPTVYVTSKDPLDETGAVRTIKSKGEVPTLAETVRNYLLRIPGNGAVMLALPRFELADGVNSIPKYASDNHMERTWGAFVTQDGVNSAFFITGTALGYMANDIPPKLPFAGDGWAQWVDGWLKTKMFNHRYFDATPFNPIKAEKSLIRADDVKPIPSLPPEAQNPATAPGGASKWHLLEALGLKKSK